MPVSKADIKFRKSTRQTDISTGGFRKGSTIVISGQRHALFPRVTKAERDAGWERLRKEFCCNENLDNDEIFELLIYPVIPSNGDDWFTMASGTQRDTIADTASLFFFGCGKLDTALLGGETEVILNMETTGIPFKPGGLLNIHNKAKTSQTIQDGTTPGKAQVRVGDSCVDNAGTWEKIATTDDTEYPNGIYIGDNAVFTAEAGQFNTALLRIADTAVVDEVLATVVTANDQNQIALTNLAGISQKLMVHPGYIPTVTVMAGGLVRTVTIDSDGVCNGYCTDGEINRDTGEWVTDIIWNSPPDGDEDITITYWDQPYLYVAESNIVTVYLDEQVPTAYAIENTFAGGVIEAANIVASISNSVISTGGDLAYDEINFPVEVNNYGAEEDDILFTFSNATTFSCAGTYEGSLGTGTIGADFSPINPKTGTAYFTVLAAGWQGTPQAGDTWGLSMHPGAHGVWLKQKGEAGAAYEPDNLFVLEYMIN